MRSLSCAMIYPFAPSHKASSDGKVKGWVFWRRESSVDDFDQGLVHAIRLHEVIERSCVIRMQAHAAGRGGCAKPVGLSGAMNGEVAGKEDRPRHRRIVIKRRVVHRHHGLHRVKPRRREFPGPRGGYGPAMGRGIVEQHRHFLIRQVDAHQKLCGMRGTAPQQKQEGGSLPEHYTVMWRARAPRSMAAAWR